jgi:biopolymer transport protein ExbD
MSSKLNSACAAPEEPCTLDMSPMIDMVFLLLLFFLVNATAIIVRTDPNVQPPVASQGKPQEDGRGRIVVNVRKDGSYTAEDFNVNLPGEVEIADMVKKEKAKIDILGVVPKLHLRGDREAIFKFSRAAIKAAASVGVDQVVFSVYAVNPPAAAK